MVGTLPRRDSGSPSFMLQRGDAVCKDSNQTADALTLFAQPLELT